MPAQLIQIRDETFALLPQAEYQELVAARAGVSLPPPPKKSRRGTYPAAEAIRVSIARQLIVDRLAAGLSVEALAERAGVSLETVKRLAGGRHAVRPATVDKVAAALRSDQPTVR